MKAADYKGTKNSLLTLEFNVYFAGRENKTMVRPLIGYNSNK